MSTQPARGMRDFLPDELRRREYVVRIVRDVYERYGFEPLETPAVENIDTLLGKYGEEGNKLIFKILKRGEHEASGQADLALRYDLTVPLARVVAHYQATLPKFFKRYQIQPVWRADRPARSRFREFYQCDIDVIGTDSPVVEAELLGAAAEVLERLGFKQFFIRLNHRAILTSWLTWAGVPRPQHEDALITIDKRDKIGAEGVLEELAARGIDTTNIRSFLTASGPVGSDEKFSDIAACLENDLAAVQAIDNLREIIGLCQNNAARDYILPDWHLARGLSYYTGAIMEIGVRDLPGSLGGGGRYDNLIGMFLGRSVSACGFSLGLERIMVVMNERGMFPDDVVRGSADVMITMFDQTRADALALATVLRAANVRVDVYPEADKLGKQFKYASDRRARFVAIIGEDERNSGTVSVKNLATQQQVSVDRNSVVEYIKTALDSREH